jgi:hypothetical protein
MATLLAEAGEELAGDGGGEGDFGDEEEGAAALREDVIDGREIDLRFAGAGNALQQKGLEFAAVERGLDAGEGGGLVGVEGVGRAVGGGEREGGVAEAEELAAGEGAGGLARVFEGLFELGEVVFAGVEFEEGEEFAFGLGEFDAFGRMVKRTRSCSAGARRGSLAVMSCSTASQPFFSRLARTVLAVGSFLMRWAAERERRSRRRRTWTAGSSSVVSNRSWRRTSRPASVRV